ncbi:MAG: tRNA pseudouridine(13) synthase TruD [Phycisphaerales bacterium]|nr:tRNA pseudouridine(13) synthase TruD [Phycisphaerales bacterium]
MPIDSPLIANPLADLPRLLDFDRLPGTIKADYTDFIVEEIPLYPASGSGTHTYFLLEKTGLSTMNALGDIARALNVKRRDIGYAGLKDARAVTRQWMSVEHMNPRDVQKLDIPRMRVLKVEKHSNKLKLGHLSGNRFTIRVRDTHPERLAQLQDALRKLAQLGVPNYFGQQRFGGRGDTWAVGRAIAVGEMQAALDLILGRPGPYDHGEILRGRQLYEAGRYQDALRRWPGMFRNERRALKALAQSRGSVKRGFYAIDLQLRRFYISAYQSHLFNQVVARRMPHGLDKLMGGDLAFRHAGHAVFLVDDAAVEQPRADAFEISPTGPLFGYRMTQPTGEPAAMEAAALAAEDLRPDAFENGHSRVQGSRRPMRFPLEDADARLGADHRGAYLELAFVLPRGCYATSLLRELFRDEVGASGNGERHALEDSD